MNGSELCQRQGAPTQAKVAELLFFFRHSPQPLRHSLARRFLCGTAGLAVRGPVGPPPPAGGGLYRLFLLALALSPRPRACFAEVVGTEEDFLALDKMHAKVIGALEEAKGRYRDAALLWVGSDGTSLAELSFFGIPDLRRHAVPHPLEGKGQFPLPVEFERAMCELIEKEEEEWTPMGAADWELQQQRTAITAISGADVGDDEELVPRIRTDSDAEEQADKFLALPSIIPGIKQAQRAQLKRLGCCRPSLLMRGTTLCRSSSA